MQFKIVGNFTLYSTIKTNVLLVVLEAKLFFFITKMNDIYARRRQNICPDFNVPKQYPYVMVEFRIPREN